MFSRIVTVLFLVPLFVHAEVPDWVKNQGKSAKYSELRYLTGFGMAKLDKNGNKADVTQLASDYAKKNLIEKIRVNVSSNVVSKSEESEKKYSTYFSSAIQSTASLDLQGLETLFYFDDDEHIMYGLAVVSREAITATYDTRVSDLRTQIQDHIANGRKFDDQNQRAKALEEYLACYPLFRQLEEAETILLAAGTDESKSMKELDKTVSSGQITVTQVRQAVDKLVQRPINSTDDLAWYLIYTLNRQTDLQGKNVMVAPFTYQDTRMGSPFSRYFKQALEQKAVEIAQWSVVQQTTDVQPKTRDVAKEFAVASGANCVLTGTYWELPEGVKVQAVLRNVADGRLIASAEQIVTNALIQSSNQSLKPQNFKEAFADQKDFRQGEVVGGGLSLEVWTNKGVDNLLFTKGEHMIAYVRVNMPCYIRFIYHLADGERTLLLDSYYIDESKVNKVVQIQPEFYCDAPYGGEVLQAFARTEDFDRVETTEKDGYKYLNEDLKKFLVATRGFKPVKPAALQVEQRIAITSMEQ
ncbi:MAG TPA: hypothetical protein VI758_05510 [Bacteroidota bacterium]